MKEETGSRIDQYYYEGSVGSCYLVVASLCLQSFLYRFFACDGISQGHLCYTKCLLSPSHISEEMNLFNIVETYFEFQALDRCSDFPETRGFQLEPWLRQTAVPSLLPGYD